MLTLTVRSELICVDCDQPGDVQELDARRGDGNRGRCDVCESFRREREVQVMRRVVGECDKWRTELQEHVAKMKAMYVRGKDAAP